jgi:parallel beta helix pectate lyase-like protein
MAPTSSYAPGEDMRAANTGYAGDGLAASDLTPVSGSVTYGTAYNGQTITGKAYSGTVTLSGSNITIKDCSLTYSGSSAFGFDIYGTNNRVDHCTVTSPGNGEMYEPIFIEPSSTGAKVTYDDISRGENLLTTYGASPTIANNYMHDSCGCGDPDGIELYGGSNVTIQDNRIDYDGMYEAPINIAPWSNYKVQGATIRGNFLDHGQSVILLDNQNTSCGGGTKPVGDCLINVVVEDNAFGGHQCPSSNPQCVSIYHPSLNYEGRPYVQTAADQAANPNAVLWPTTGTDVTKWEENTDLTPDKDGQIVIPT